MGWRKIGNRRYYYRKFRERGRAVNEYVGPGLVGELAADIEAIEHVRVTTRRQREAADKGQFRTADQLVRQFSKQVELLVKATLMGNAFHQHQGEWRLRRNGSDASNHQ